MAGAGLTAAGLVLAAKNPAVKEAVGRGVRSTLVKHPKLQGPVARYGGRKGRKLVASARREARGPRVERPEGFGEFILRQKPAQA